MRRSLLLFLLWTLTFSFIAIGTLPVVAADLYWQIVWDYDHTITETLRSEQAWTQAPAGEGWVKLSDREYSRQLSGWKEYLSLDDRFPLALGGKDLQFVNYAIIQGEPIRAENRLATAQADRDVEFTLMLPGFVRETNAVLNSEADMHYLQWQFNGLATSERSWFVRLWVVDGFLSAILVIILGGFGLLIFFIVRVRKVSKFIKEEYSVENIDQKELEGEVEAELEQMEKER